MKSVAMVIDAVRYMLILALYGGFTAIVCSVYLITAKAGPTPPVSPAMQCAMNLAAQYFLVYLLLYVCTTLNQFTDIGGGFAKALEPARATVQFCPMLAILFIGLRMFCLQITDQKG